MSVRATLIILLFATLLALIAGGIFIYKYRPTTAYVPSQPVIKNEEVVLAESTTTPLDIAVQELLEKSAEVIAQTQKFIQEIQTAKEKSSKVRGVYLNEFIANSQTPIASKTRQDIVKLLDETGLNSVVIDIKEAYGPNLSLSLKTFINELHRKDAWVIARIVVFRDASLTNEKPHWYLTTTTDATSTDSGQATSTMVLWQDNASQYWLDPKNEEVRNYLIEFSKKAVDYGFDELQFDYIRYPDDYDEVTGQEKIAWIGDFFAKLSQSLREYKPSVILSVDIFGYVATQFQSYEIGQRLVDAGRYFDYLSFMLYPSHFYGGFRVPPDSARQLPALYFPYQDETTTSTAHLVSNNPYNVIFRSVLQAYDYFALFGLPAKIRPWLQDFNLKADTERGIFYDAEKIKAQIQAAEDAGTAGWLLWNSANIYTNIFI